MNLESQEQKGLSARERQIIDALVRQGKQIIRPEDLQSLPNGIAGRPNLILSRLTKKGWLQRLRAGVYRILPLGSESVNMIAEDAWLIAVEIFAPCYIGGWSAAEHWDLTEQIFNKTLVITAKKQRMADHTISGLQFRTRSVPSKVLFGTRKVWSNNIPIQVSDIHKTLIDILDDPAIGGGGRASLDVAKRYMEQKEADTEILWQYALKLDSGGAFKRLGFIAETILQLPEAYLEKVHTKCKQGIIQFDPTGPQIGKLYSRWGLRVNIPSVDIL
jgi:predicted transcriptional regulator of viral defense system